MALTGIVLHHYRQAQPRREKWSWAQSILFIVLTCGVFWAGVIALAWRLL